MCGGEAARLFTIAAGFHIAPAARPVPACIQKQPAAGARRTGMQARRVAGGEKVYCFLRKQQHGRVGLAVGWLPFPDEPSVFPSQLPMLHAPCRPPLEGLSVFCRRRLSVQPAIADSRERLPQCEGFTQGGVLRGHGQSIQPGCFRLCQKSRLTAEPQQLRIAGQQLAGAVRREAIVERIHKVQRNMLGIQLEWRVFLRQM